MKKLTGYNFLVMMITLTLPILLTNCGSSKSANESVNKKDAEWYRSKEWLNGLQLTPHESINQQEFSRQYRLNKTWWNEAFNFLKTHDLAELKPGKYVIDSDNVFATVTELNPNEKGQVKWEAHRNYNDLQYVIKGKAEMGVASSSSPKALVTVPYDPKTDNENFTVTGEKYYDAVPGTFFIFSPKEMHRPAFKVDGYNDIKKIVIKVRVPK
ncbi:MAG: YhcH/YjgK/YiaL family protein [Ginsengibacter sp.]